jgi:hypothetical protein
MMHNNGFFGSWSENGADEMNDRLVFFFFFFFFFFFLRLEQGRRCTDRKDKNSHSQHK